MGFGRAFFYLLTISFVVPFLKDSFLDCLTKCQFKDLQGVNLPSFKNCLSIAGYYTSFAQIVLLNGLLFSVSGWT